jgi:[ribosomal protein S18]-alanine N-acetyltransferase
VRDWQTGEIGVRAAGLALLLSDLERQTQGSQAWSVTQVREELAAPGRRVWLALGDRSALGYALTWTNEEIADVQRVGVLPSVRRQGIGRALLCELLSALQKSSAARVLLEVAEANTPAVALYEGEGFAVIDRRKKYYGEDAALVMERNL